MNVLSMHTLKLEPGNGNGKYSVPKGQELQSLDMHFPSNKSATDSTAWSRSSQTSLPDFDQDIGDKFLEYYLIIYNEFLYR